MEGGPFSCAHFKTPSMEGGPFYWAHITTPRMEGGPFSWAHIKGEKIVSSIELLCQNQQEHWFIYNPRLFISRAAIYSIHILWYAVCITGYFLKDN